MTPSIEAPRLVTGCAGERSARAAPKDPAMTDQPLDLPTLESAAKAAIEKYLEQLDLSRGLDKEDIHGLHIGDEREAMLKASHIRAILSRLQAAETEVDDLKGEVRDDNAAISMLANERRDALARATTAEALVGELVTALERIERWFGEFPATGKYWLNDEGAAGMEMSYAACYGSNGERDFMRELARVALSKARPDTSNPKEIVMNTELAEACVLLNELGVPSNRDGSGDPGDLAMTTAERIRWLVARPDTGSREG